MMIKTRKTVEMMIPELLFINYRCEL
jgi:hypothetical protein